jgi:hypothetical protein
MATSNPEIAGRQGGIEQPKPFVATPERVSQYLELKTEEVTAQMKSVEGRQALFDQLLEHEDVIRQEHADFHPEALRTQLDTAGETLLAHEHYLESVNAPEKKSMMRRAWDTVKAFPYNHPVVTTLLVAAAATGAIAGGLYLAGYWETAMASVGLSKIMGTAEAVGELAPITPEVAPLPGGGVYDIPAPLPAPGEFPDIPY